MWRAADYPPNWKTEIRPAVLERDGHRCVFCDVPNHELGFRDIYDRWISAAEWSGKPGMTEKEYRQLAEEQGVKLIKIVLTVAHIVDRNKKNADMKNLASLCPRCHFRHDAEYNAAKAARTRALKRGQLELPLEVA